jgi:putative nucleotidyltransferase with HDIG domain
VAFAAVVYLLGLSFVFGVLVHAVVDLRAETDARRDAQEIRIAADRLLKSVLDMESGMRALLITGEPRFLEPWEEGRRRIPGERRRFTRLAALRSEGPTVPGSVIHRLDQRIASYVADFSVPLVRHAREHSLPRHRHVTEVAEGKRRVDELRRLFARVQDAESLRVRREDDDARSAASRALIAAILGLLLMSALVAATVRYLARTVTRPISRVAERAQALAAGESPEELDSVTAPNAAREVRSLTDSFGLMARAIRDQTERLEGHNTLLERRVRERTEDLEEARYEALLMLAVAAEYRDDDTHRHTLRVGRNAALIARQLNLSDTTTELLRVAAPLHDVGKIGVSDAILLKPGRLTADEFEAMKQHVVVGADILGASQDELFHVASQIAYTHHERWDGSGYPQGLAGQAIPLAGRIVAVVDVFDALTHERPYKPAWPVREAVEEIRRGAGSHFDPAVVAAFEALDPAALLADDDERTALRAAG